MYRLLGHLPEANNAALPEAHLFRDKYEAMRTYLLVWLIPGK